MAQLFVDYVPDKVIIGELKHFHVYNKALRDGVPRRHRPALPRPVLPRASRLSPGAVRYATNSMLLSLAEMLGMARAQQSLALNSIRTDEYAAEPMSCGIHKAYTKYGLARLAQNDVVSAIQALSYSTKIHPCPHTTRYGLSYELRNKLLPYAEAEDAIELFDVIAWRFSGQKRYV